MTIRLLRTLVAISDKKTFSAAAEAVHITHAAVSQQMQSLEADLGVSLFNRATRTPELTPIGKAVVERARVLIADYDNLIPAVLSDGGMSGPITLGALRTTLTGLTPQAMAVFKSKFPDVGLHIRPGLTGTLLADIARGTVDAAIVTRPHLLPLGLQFRQLAQEEMQLIAAPNETETDPQILLRSRPYIRFDRSAVLGALIENWITTKHIPVRETMELDSPEAIASMVHASLGVSIVPQLVVPSSDNLPVKRMSLGPDAPKRDLGLAYHQDQIKTRAIDEIFQAFTSAIKTARTDKS